MNSTAIQRYGKRSTLWLVNKATYYFNRYIRERDTYLGCISCGTQSGLMHAGHFFSAGHHPYVRFYEDNVHKQCLRCNRFLHGNLINYDKELYKKIGAQRYHKLKELVAYYKRAEYKWNRFFLIDIIETYKEKHNVLR